MKNFKSLILLAAVAMLPAGNIYGQETQVRKINSRIVLPKNSNLEKVAPSSNTMLYAPKMMNTAKTAANVSITISSKYAAGVTPSQISVYNKDFKLVDYMNGGDKTVSVPEGTYDMFMSFYGGTTYYIFKENITVKDGETYVFDQQEAKNDITYKFFDENDNELYMDIYDGSKMVEKGTAESMSRVSAFMHKDYGLAAMMISLGYMPLKYPMEFYVNDVSDKYVVAHGTNIIANGTTYTYKDGNTDFKPGIEKFIGGENLVECVTKLNVNDIAHENDKGKVQGYNFTLLYDGLSIAGEKGFLPENNRTDMVVRNFMYCPESDAGSVDKVNVIYAPIISNYSESTEDEYGVYTDYYGLRGCAMLGDKNGIKYINAGADLDWGGLNVPEGMIDARYYPGNPEFTFDNADGTLEYGNSCPVTSLRALRYEADGFIDGWDTPYFVGRYGELYESEAYLADYMEEVMEDGSTLTTIDNPFVTVDGLKGSNKTEVYFDLNKEDFSAPTVQMLTFKNAEGKITDRLDKCEGARVIMAGGDFKYHIDLLTYLGYFTCHDASVELEYAPYGTDDWKALAVNEIPEKKFMPYFGNYYEAALDNVQCTEDNQWFDLKIVMKDGAGNYQSQVMSPAFKVLSNVGSGISEVENGKAVLTYNAGMINYSGIADFEVRDLSGAALRSAHGSAISVEGLPAGAYIVTAKTAADGTLTKKFMVK